MSLMFLSHIHGCNINEIFADYWDIPKVHSKIKKPPPVALGW
jgi:hypothetical protein